jgi:dTDP-4-dehydrorhamnose 3,5-epimerase
MGIEGRSAIIQGVDVISLNVIIDERGKVMHMMRSDSPIFTKFGEIYFSVVNPGVIKGWKKHLRMTQHFAVPVGKIKLVIYDDREGSSCHGNIEVIEIGEDSYCLVKIPPLVWYGFQGVSSIPALIANCTDIPHDPAEGERLDISNSKIPWDWNT